LQIFLDGADEFDVVYYITLFILAQKPMVQLVLKSFLRVLECPQSYGGAVASSAPAKGLAIRPGPNAANATQPVNAGEPNRRSV
jgi:hypothetical protein